MLWQRRTGALLPSVHLYLYYDHCCWAALCCRDDDSVEEGARGERLAPGDPEDGVLDAVLLPPEAGSAPTVRRLGAGFVNEPLLSDCRDDSDGWRRDEEAGAPEDLDVALWDPWGVVAGAVRPDGAAAGSAAFAWWNDEDDSDSDTHVDSYSSS
jgi:hypothetical protein